MSIHGLICTANSFWTVAMAELVSGRKWWWDSSGLLSSVTCERYDLGQVRFFSETNFPIRDIVSV